MEEMIKLSRLKTNQFGAVSMITVVFIAIILTVLATSFIRLTINEQRESVDDDLTTRAYYAAESGVQDAIAAIKDQFAHPGDPAHRVNNPDECTPDSSGDLSGSSSLDAEYTCQIIDLTPDDYLADLEKGETEQFIIDSESGDDVNTVNISWHINAAKNSGGDGGFDLRSSVASSLLKDYEWYSDPANPSDDNKFPAMIRLQMISTPHSGVTRSSIDSYTLFLNPTLGGSHASINDLTAISLNHGIRNVPCNNTAAVGEYVCTFSINSLADDTHDYSIRVQALYNPTHIKIDATTSAGVAVSLINAQAVIDVTGRAGDVYRRVEERVDLSPDYLSPEFAILSAEDICKNFVITDSTVDIPNPNPSLAKIGFLSANGGSLNGSCNN